MQKKNDLHFSDMGSEMTPDEKNSLLTFAFENGMLDLAAIRNEMAKKRREKYLAMNPYNIWQGSNGYWYSYIPEKDKRKQIKKKSRDEVEEAIITYWQDKEIDPTVREMFDEWNDRRLELGKISEATAVRNDQIYRRFFPDAMSKRKIRNVKPDDLMTWLEDTVSEYGLTAKAFNNLKTIVRGTFKFAKRKGFTKIGIESLLQESDMTDIKFKKSHKEDYEEVYDEDESEKLVDFLTKNRTQNNLCLLLMWATGMRIGEAVVLRHEDIGSNYVYVRGTLTRYHDGEHWVRERKEFPKTEAGWRQVVVPDKYLWVLDEIKNLNPENKYVFVGKDGDFLSAGTVRNHLKRINKQLGIFQKSPHKIRKTYGTILLDNNVDKRFILTQMGHADILTTEQHYHRNRRSLDARQEIISQIPDL